MGYTEIIPSHIEVGDRIMQVPGWDSFYTVVADCNLRGEPHLSLEHRGAEYLYPLHLSDGARWVKETNVDAPPTPAPEYDLGVIGSEEASVQIACTVVGNYLVMENVDPHTGDTITAGSLAWTPDEVSELADVILAYQALIEQPALAQQIADISRDRLAGHDVRSAVTILAVDYALALANA